MIRNVSLEDISDGKLYTGRDMVKIEANDCANCSGCCRGMGSSIILDPMDIYRLKRKTGRPFPDLLRDTLELNVVDGLVLPNLKMQEGSDACIFLNTEIQRCTIHEERPGFCRLFPLGRYYDDQGRFWYINQVNECGRAGRTKIRVSRWLGQEDLKSYESFCMEWHHLQKKAQGVCQKVTEEQARDVNMLILREFFLKPYDTSVDFYFQFASRLAPVMADLDAFAGTI